MSRPTDQPLIFRVLAAVRNLKLEPSDRLLLTYLAYRQGRNGKAWPAIRTIAKDLGLSTTTVQDSIGRLHQAGVVERSSGKGCRANRYVVRLECVSPRHVSTDGNVSVSDTGMCQSPTQNVSVPDTESLRNPSENPSLGAQSSPASSTQGANETRGKARRQARRSPFIPPTAEEVRAYADSVGDPQFEVDAFIKYYTGTGWKRKNGTRVLDWRATVRAWMTRNDDRRIERGEPPHDGYSQYGTHPATEQDIQELVEAGVLSPEVSTDGHDTTT
jgi:hypothetical protein